MMSSGEVGPPRVCSRVRLEVDLGVLRGNFARIATAVSPAQVMTVLKADGYGLGGRPIAKALVAAGAARIGVAELNEALEVADLGVPVHIIGGILPSEVEDAVAAGITLPITDLASAQRISAVSVRQGRRSACHFIIDTGMGRLGLLASDAAVAIREAVRLPGLDCEGISTHFPVAYRSGEAYTQGQINRFLALLGELASSGITFRVIHCANSDAVNNFPQAYRVPFNLVRTGINLYGAFDLEGRRALELQSVLTLKTRLTAVRRLPEGMSIGYGCTYTLARETLVGTISAGYADGLPLALSNRGHVLIHDQPCPVLGRVSMDYTTVDLSQVPQAEVGDEVVCLGGEGPNAVSVEHWAQLKGTHSYDIICSFGRRVARCYV